MRRINWTKFIRNNQRKLAVPAGATLLRDPQGSYGATIKSKFRADVQGLRAIAVGLVLIYHAGAPFLPGGFVGVDVFFVISGFLITGLLLKEINEKERISLSDFYARRARRILPASLLVLLVVGLSTIAFLPRTRWESIATEIFASAFNAVNWVFASSSTDYLRNDEAASPIQHYWTLAVEEQFYIVWPLILVLAVFLSRRKKTRKRISQSSDDKYTLRTRLIVLAITIISVSSLAFSIYYTEFNPGAAYFVTTTRIYELGIGAMVAVFANRLSSISTKASTLLGWVGLSAIVCAGLFFSSATSFPGYAALLPTLGTAAIIIAGMAGPQRSGVGRMLSLRPFTWVGDISFSLYLWHWPMIVFATFFLNGLSFYQGMAVILMAFIPAYVSYRFVEQPIMKWDYTQEKKAALGLGLIGMLATSLVGLSIQLVPPVPTAPVASTGPAFEINAEEKKKDTVVPLSGAELLAKDAAVGDPDVAVTQFRPTAIQAAQDFPPNYNDGCHQDAQGTVATSCTYGEADGDFHIALVGDSHAAQWLPAVIRLAEENGWRVDSFTKSACPLTSRMVMSPGFEDTYDSCLEWANNVTKTLTSKDAPDLVLTTNSLYQTAGGESFSEGLAEKWNEIESDGVAVSVLVDTPVPGIHIAECVEVNEKALNKCAVDREVAMRNGAEMQLRAAEKMGSVNIIDLNDFICPESRCAPVVGNVLVYRDTNHLTATYAKTLAPALGDSLAKAGAPVRKMNSSTSD